MTDKFRFGRVVGVVAALALAASPTAALAAPGDTPGGEATTGSDYSDLVVLLRAEDGTPLLKKYMVPGESAEDPVTAEYCVQPVSYSKIPGVGVTTSPVDGRDVWVVPLQGEWLPPGVAPDPLPVAEIEACDPQPQVGMFVSEVELERLNMARTADRVMDEKLAAVETKLKGAKTIALDPAGRITPDGVPIDAAPEHAAIYQSLMLTGTLPGLPTALPIGPVPSDPTYNSQFGAWELAAAAVGTAASKGVPITIDTVEYYNQVIGFPPTATYTSPWGVEFLRSWNPDDLTVKLADGRRHVDYSGFTYNRAATYPGSVTYLNVRELKWYVAKIVDTVSFTNPTLGTETLTGVEAFAQMADDTRAVIGYLHENEVVLPGFYMDPVGVNTHESQLKATTDPAVDLGELPAEAFLAQGFPVSASLWNPHDGILIPDARLKITVDAPATLTEDQLSVVAGDGQSVPFAAVDGNLVGWWGPETGFPVDQGYYAATDFTAVLAEGASTGDYQLTLELVRTSAPDTALATDTATTHVNTAAPTVMWGSDVPTLATQGAYTKVPLRVYSPAAGQGTLQLDLTGPEALQVGDVKVYGAEGDRMLTMPLTALENGTLSGSWDLALTQGYTDVLWYVVFNSTALDGGYQLGVSLEGGNTVESAVIAVVPAVDHSDGGGGGGGGGGEDNTAPVVTLELDEQVDASVTFLVSTADAAEAVDFSYRLTKDNVAGTWQAFVPSTGGELELTALEPGSYILAVKAVDAAGNASEVETVSWTVATPVPDTTVVTGPADMSWIMTGTAQFVLDSDNPAAGFEYRVNAGDYQPCASDNCSVEGLEEGRNIVKLRAVAGNKADATPVTRTLYMPERATLMTRTAGWQVRVGADHLFGEYLYTKRARQSVRDRYVGITSVSLVATTGRGQGKVHVYVAGVRVTAKPINLAGWASNASRLIEVKSFAKPRTGTVKVSVASTGKPVSIDAVGVMN